MVVNDPTLTVYHEPPGAFEMALTAAATLTPDEKIALMKWLSASLDGPRFYTATEVDALVMKTVEQIFGQRVLQGW